MSISLALACVWVVSVSALAPLVRVWPIWLEAALIASAGVLIGAVWWAEGPLLALACGLGALSMLRQPVRAVLARVVLRS